MEIGSIFLLIDSNTCPDMRLACVCQSARSELRPWSSFVLLAHDARPTFLSTELYLFLEIYDEIPTASAVLLRESSEHIFRIVQII